MVGLNCYHHPRLEAVISCQHCGKPLCRSCAELYSGHHVCKLTGLKMDTDDVKVKYVCNCEYGYEYEKCPVYQDR